MQTRLPLLLMAVLSLSISPGGSAAAQALRSVAPAAGRPKAATCVSLVKGRGGDRPLVINYPWKVHLRPSIEVRLVTGKDAGPSGIRPLFFVEEHFKGEVKVTVYRCQDGADGMGTRQSLTENKLDFEVLGRRNSLGKPAVCVVHRFAADDPNPGDAPGAVAVFCSLPGWAINKRLLQLDLPREDFAQPGKLYVWFLRDDTILWKETVDWPGHGRPKTPKHE